MDLATTDVPTDWRLSVVAPEGRSSTKAAFVPLEVVADTLICDTP